MEIMAFRVSGERREAIRCRGRQNFKACFGRDEMLQLPGVAKVFEPSGILDPAWGKIDALNTDAVPTPLAAQPSEYLLETYGDRSWGAIGSVTLRGWQTRHNLAILAEWEAQAPTAEFNGPDSFLDRIAFFFPSSEDTPLGTMGSEEHPAIIWSWRSDKKLERLVAKGPGTITSVDNAGLYAEGMNIDGRWRVQISGTKPDGPMLFSVALWKGAAADRGGLKSFVPDWIAIPPYSR